MTEYFVSPAGADTNPGTASRPFRTFRPLSSGRIPLVAGDAVRVRGGTIDSHGVTVRDVHGSADAPIEITAAGEAIPVLDVSNGDRHGVTIERSSWIRLRGLEVRGAAMDGIHVSCTTKGPIDIEAATVHGHARSGEGNGIHALRGVKELSIRGCHVREGHGSAGAECAGIRFDRGVRTGRVLGCESYRNPGPGLAVTNRNRRGRIVLRRCVAHRNGLAAEAPASIGAFHLDGVQDVERCIAFNNAGPGVWGRESNGQLSLRHCTTWANGGVGYRVDSPDGRLRNCLAWNDGGGHVDGPAALDDRWNAWSLDLGEPRFRTTDDTEPAFLQPKSDSPLVGAGVHLRRSGTRSSPDVGARSASIAESSEVGRRAGSAVGGRSPVLPGWRRVALEA